MDIQHILHNPDGSHVEIFIEPFNQWSGDTLKQGYSITGILVSAGKRSKVVHEFTPAVTTARFAKRGETASHILGYGSMQGLKYHWIIPEPYATDRYADAHVSRVPLEVIEKAAYFNDVNI